MKVAVIVLCQNEELMLPFFLRHYDKIADEIHVFDNNSTDKSISIIKSNLKCIIHSYKTNGIDDQIHLEIKNTFYKTLKSDWFIVVDMDEFVYHPSLREILEKYIEERITIPQIKGYGMVSDKLPIDNGSQIYDQIKEGTPYVNYNKNVVFHKSVDINFNHGCHTCSPVGVVKFSPNYIFKLLHYKMLSKDYVIEKAKKVKLSLINKRKKWGAEAASVEIMAQEYDWHWNNRIRVIE